MTLNHCGSYLSIVVVGYCDTNQDFHPNRPNRLRLELWMSYLLLADNRVCLTSLVLPHRIFHANNHLEPNRSMVNTNGKQYNSLSFIVNTYQFLERMSTVASRLSSCMSHSHRGIYMLYEIYWSLPLCKKRKINIKII